jgi:diketogulonate reductase-like aldo/keto reductase
MKQVVLAAGKRVPALGLGTWRMGESRRTRAAETAAVWRALQIGYRLIDTAEMYGEGGAEEVVGAALTAAIGAGEVARDDVFIVSKVYPHHAGRRDAVAACRRSLERLQLDAIDLYLLHWRGNVPLAQTVDAFEQLRDEGRIRHWGVSNFDVDDLQELYALPHGAACAANQVWYSAGQRGIEHSLLPWQRERRLPAMAYSPIDQGALRSDATLAKIGARHGGATAAQVALAWAMRHGDVIAIPKALDEAHQRDNFAAASLALTADDLAAIDAKFPPPKRRGPLAMT